MTSSPYLKNEDRLADVVAAIQAMGTYKFYKLSFAGWADRISGDETKANHWQKVFEEHPEFFRLDTKREKASLVWRRQHPRRYNVDNDRIMTREELLSLQNEERYRLSRNPLTSNELATLIQTATDLHSRAIERKRDNRWWVSGAFGILGALLGVIVQSWLN